MTDSPDRMWPKKSVPPTSYEYCFRRALRRIAVTLNSDREHSVCATAWKKLTDVEMDTKFGKNKLDSLLVRLMTRDVDFNADDEDAAENYFYGMFEFRRKSDPPRILIEYTTTSPFLKWSYDGLHLPEYSDSEVSRDQFGDENVFMEACATNYLVKNFWHNFVHNELQGIRYHNYREFGGAVRFESDFEADNLSNILLVDSYGLQVSAAGNRSFDIRDNMEQLFRRNRCNRVFALRAAARVADTAKRKEAEDWEDTEWRYRRGVANHISASLIINGFSATSLGVYLTGTVKKGRDGFYRNGDVVVDVNGYRIATSIPAYVPTGSPKGFKRKRDNHHRDVGVVVLTQYKALLRESKRLRRQSKDLLASLFERAGVAH